MAYIKCSNRANPAYDPSLIPAERLSMMLDRMRDHYCAMGGYCEQCHGSDFDGYNCVTIPGQVWDAVHWSYEPNITDEVWFNAALQAYEAEFGHPLGQSNVEDEYQDYLDIN
jgi:hypothetical protein